MRRHFAIIASLAFTFLLAAPASALPREPIAVAPSFVLVKGGHGGHGDHGRHLGWSIGRHRGWSHSHHRMH